MSDEVHERHRRRTRPAPRFSTAHSASPIGGLAQVRPCVRLLRRREDELRVDPAERPGGGRGGVELVVPGDLEQRVESPTARRSARARRGRGPRTNGTRSSSRPISGVPPRPRAEPAERGAPPAARTSDGGVAQPSAGARRRPPPSRGGRRGRRRTRGRAASGWSSSSSRSRHRGGADLEQRRTGDRPRAPAARRRRRSSGSTAAVGAQPAEAARGRGPHVARCGRRGRASSAGTARVRGHVPQRRTRPATRLAAAPARAAWRSMLRRRRRTPRSTRRSVRAASPRSMRE